MSTAQKHGLVILLVGIVLAIFPNTPLWLDFGIILLLALGSFLFLTSTVAKNSRNYNLLNGIKKYFGD